jgi:hypothetical protein
MIARIILYPTMPLTLLLISPPLELGQLFKSLSIYQYPSLNLLQVSPNLFIVAFLTVLVLQILFGYTDIESQGGGKYDRQHSDQ